MEKRGVLLSIISIFILLTTNVLADDILFQEDWEAENFAQWTKVRVEGSVGDLDEDVTIPNLPSQSRACPGDFSGCGSDENNFARVEDDAGIVADVSATQCENDAELSYWKKTKNLESDDTLEVDWKLSSSEDWTNLEAVANTEWSTSSFILEGSAGNEIQIRFWLNDGNSDNGDTDDIQVSCEASENGNHEIPEFTAIGAGIALLGAGYYIYRRRKK